MGERERYWEGFSFRRLEGRGSRLLWPTESQHGFIVAVAHQVSRERRHRRTVGRRVIALY
jgi:hypothetical protein